ncbi:MAG: undecaprenyl-diphosphatase [Micromonosporaceae bacterium]|jgi:undecaprenyl-diphosphatase|nr:undecaprenyl-diphosphatase [Micromonosporaceae bacterium]
MTPQLTYPEAILVGALQGVTELFPVSSLGHSILLPALIGGRWAADLNVSAPESPYLAFIVGLHVATALALLAFFWRDWLRILTGFASSVRYRRLDRPDERLAWMVIIGTIPVGVMGLLLEHTFRTVLGRPVPAAIFLTVNGLILFAAERLRRAAAVAKSTPADPPPAMPAEPATDPDLAADQRIARRTIGETTLIATAQVAALLPGISRSGVTMAAGLARGLSYADAARFSFLLATPVILAAGVLKLPDLFGPLGAGIGGQVVAGSLASGVAAYFAVRFLMRYFQTRTLTPFAIYCVLAGLGSLAWLTL